LKKKKQKKTIVWMDLIILRKKFWNFSRIFYSC